MSAPTGLVVGYDLVILDLDGVVYLVDRPIPGAAEAVAALRTRGVPIGYATNNASRRAADVADLLTGMGVPARTEEVVTSAQAAAEVIAGRQPSGALVLVVGAEALRADIRDVGLTVVDRADESPAVVVQGFGPQVGWATLAEACLAVGAGAEWVATNTDATLPSPRGLLPGNGSLVAALRTALGRGPDLVVGKPEPALFQTTARHAGAGRPLVVGDRLDTDVAGANRAGMDSLLVLTGVTAARDLLVAPELLRPTFVATDLSGLFTVDLSARFAPAPTAAQRVEVDGWVAERTGGGGDGPGHGGGVRLGGAGEPMDGLRALCALVWAGPPAGGVTAGSAAAEDLCRRLGLTG